MEKQTTTTQIALKWGIISALASIVLMTIMYMTDLWKNTAVSSIISLGIGIVILVMAMKEFKDANGGFMTFGQGFGLGMLASVISAVISILYQQLYMRVIDSSFPEKMKDFQYEQMESQGLSEEQIEQAISISEKFTTGGLSFLFPLLAAIFFSMIMTLIVAAIMKKNKPVF